MNKEFLQELYAAHVKCPGCPGPETVSDFFKELLGTLFPDFSKKVFTSPEELALHMKELKMQLGQMLFQSAPSEPLDGEKIAAGFFEKLPDIRKTLSWDVTAMYEGDPAAKSPNEVMRTYPGFYAVAAYRVAHELHKMQVPVIPRMITEHAHSKTGIDIHPGAKIGEAFCIDHGTGVVIGATILGGETCVGHDSIIGGNVWITRSIPPHTKMYYRAKMQNMDMGETDLIVYKTKTDTV